MAKNTIVSDSSEIKIGKCENIISTKPLVVKYADNANCNCDSAVSSLEMNFCSGVKLCLQQRKLDSLNNLILHTFDSLIKQQNIDSKEILENGDSTMLETITDYKKIKKLHQESMKCFIEYAENEMKITGAETEQGKLSTYYENNKYIEILETKIVDLEKKIKEYNK